MLLFLSIYVVSPVNAHHVSRINDILYFIHQDISQDLPAKQLASKAAYSEQHFHRVFKAVVGESLHQYIRRTRMEYAANQLMFDAQTPIIDIANQCGFSSLSSFSKAFKAVFHSPPGQWRHNETQERIIRQFSDPDVAAGYERLRYRQLVEPKIMEMPEHWVAYVRHQGYNRSIRRAWLTLTAWAKSQHRESNQQFALHHSNPAWVALEKCRYVACIGIDRPVEVRGVVNQLTIPAGLHAIFPMQGIYGELLPQVSQVFEQWLPNSGYKLRSTPAYIRYFKNHFLEEEGGFNIHFHLPIRFF